MKTIFRIARLELSTLFYSPVAWLVLVIFTFQSGFSFIEFLHRLESAYRMGWAGSELTNKMFSNRAFFASVQSNLYFYIPLLTMGLISREISSGSIKLLLSSPVTISEIVLGKFLSMMLYSLILVLILMVFVLVGGYCIASMDWGLVMSGIVGLYLLICAYSAIGLFMSSLTSYQVVAAISTLVLLAGLYFIGKVWQDIPFVKDLTYFLSIAGRSDKLISGLISSKDIIYFIIVILFFIGITIMKLKGGRESIPPAIKAGRYVFFTCIVLTAGYLSSRPLFTLYYDMTAMKSRTLTVNTQNILKKLTRPLKVTTYANLFDTYFYPFSPTQLNEDLDRLEQYTRFLPGMEFKYVYYYDSSKNEYLYQGNTGLSDKGLARKVAESYDVNIDKFLTPSEIRKVIDLRPEENRTVRLYEYDNKKGFTRMFGDHQQHPGEQEITAVLKGFLVPQPKIAFAAGSHERDIYKAGDKGYKKMTRELDFRFALINQGFKVDTVSLNDQNIPRDISCLVIADPKVMYNKIQQEKVQEYILSGGNVLFAGEPGRQDILNPLIKPLGVQLMDGILIQESKDNAPDFVLANFAKTAQRYSNNWWNTASVLSMPGAAGLIIEKNSDFNIEPTVVTNSKDTWNKTSKVNLDSAKVTYSVESGDKKAAIPVGVGLTRKIAGKEQRIMIFGDADFMSNGELGRENMETRNFSLVVEMFKWFNYGQFPIDISRPIAPDDKITIDKNGIGILKTNFLATLPGLIILLGAVTLVRRQRN